MNNESEEISINLKDLMFSILYCWKKILLIAIVFALVVDCAVFARDHIDFGQAAAEEDGAVVAMTDEEKYENEKLLLERRIEEYESMIATQYQYMRKSTLMRIDYNNAYEAIARLYVATDYQIMPGMAYQNTDYSKAIMSYYVSALSNMTILQDIASEINMDAIYLKELVSVGISSDAFIQIRVWHSSSLVAQQIVDLLIDKINELQNDVEKTIGAHSVDVVLESVYLYTDDYIGERQREEEALLIEYETALEETIATLAALENPETNYIKWTVLGGVAGAVVYVFLLCVLYLVSDKVRSADELKERFAFKILGTVKDQNLKLGKIECWLRNLEGKMADNTDANYALIAERILTCSAKEGATLVACNTDITLGQEITQNLQQHLTGLKLESCDNMLTNAQAVRSLREHSEVILVEIYGKSSLKNIRKELELIKDTNCNLIGCVFVE